MNQNLTTIFKHPALFVGGIISTVLCLILGIYYAIPRVYHISLGHSHPPLAPKLDYMVGFFVLAIICASIVILVRRFTRMRVD